MDEIGFQMGIASTAKVVCGHEVRRSHARSVQPGNKEWVTSIVTTNAAGTVLPPQIIFAGKIHQAPWYEAIPKDYRISMSENGWTNHDLGFEWLQEVFEKHTASQTAVQYRLLILDGHSSHATLEFDQFCTSKKIIPLYMPPHSSDKLQPLDVSCFGPLKQYYGQQIREAIQNGYETIDKRDFLWHYEHIHKRSFSKANILSGFRSTGLIPLQPERVLSKLRIQLKTPTPLSSLHSDSSSHYLGQTPANLYQLDHQKKEFQALQDQGLSSFVAEGMLEKAIKGAEVAMQNAVLLQQEICQLRTADKRKRDKKKTPRRFIQEGGSLTGQEGQDKTQERERTTANHAAVSTSTSTRRPPRCSNCNKEGHNRLRCPEKLTT